MTSAAPGSHTAPSRMLSGVGSAASSGYEAKVSPTCCE